MSSKRSILGLDGMTCSSCSGSIENLLRSLEGITYAEVTLTTNCAVVDYNSSIISPQFICDEVESIGFGCEVLQTIENESSSSTKRNGKKIGVEGHRHSTKVTSTNKNFIVCFEREVPMPQINLLRNNISGIDGIYDVIVTSFGDKKALQVNLDDSKAGPRHIASAADKLHLSVSIHSHGGFMMANRLNQQHQSELRKHTWDAAIATLLTIPVLLISHLVSIKSPLTSFLMTRLMPGLDTCGFVLFVLSSPVQWIVGWRFHKKAILSMQTGTLGMDFMISTGTTAAYIFSFIALVFGLISGKPNDIDAAYFETSAVLITVVVIGKFLESYARGITANAIHNLSTHRARSARLIHDESLHASIRSKGLWIGPQISLASIIPISPSDEEIDASLVQRGDCLRLVSGEVIPADGIIFSGIVGIDESMLTGESALVTKSSEAMVYGGTVVSEGSAIMVVTACGDDSTLGKIVSTVQEAQSSKPPIQEKADIIARYFVPFVSIVSFLTFTIWMLAWYLGDVPEDWYHSTSLEASHMKHHMGDSTSASKTGNPVLFAFFFALAVWVSACPCAFGLATPTAILVATGVAAKHGVLVRRGAALQHAAEISYIAFDKTGTLTQGKPQVSDIYLSLNSDHELSLQGLVRLPVNERLPDVLKSLQISSEQLISLLLLLQQAELKSNHPLANGIVDFCRKKLDELSANHRSDLQLDIIDERFDVHAGQGIAMSITLSSSNHQQISKLLGSKYPPANGNPIDVLVGNADFLSSQGIGIPASVATTATNLRLGGKIVIFAAVAMKLVSIIALSDTIRPEAPMVLQYLRDEGITCYMVTGDDWNTAVAIASSLGIEAKHVYANAKPDDKEKFVRALQDYPTTAAISQTCMFIGDGTNDSPAMARASVGVAMAGGTDIAVEAGDVVFCKNSLTAVATLIALSKTTMRRIWLNFAWALGYNLCLIPIAAGVFYPFFHLALAPMMAGMAMAFSSISIVISSLLLGLFQPPALQPSTSLQHHEPGIELQDYAEENDPLTCKCPTNSSPLSALGVKKANYQRKKHRMQRHDNHIDNREGGGPGQALTSLVHRAWKVVFSLGFYDPISTQDDDELMMNSRGMDDGAVSSILQRIASTSNTPQSSSKSSSPVAASSSPLLYKCYGSSSGSPAASQEDDLASCGRSSCGCGRDNCRCPMNCSCKSYQSALV
jgi:P-type Cu+ transporter